jgi:hypothetical protein
MHVLLNHLTYNVFVGFPDRPEEESFLPKEKEKGQMDNDLQNIAQKHKDRATRTPLKTGGELRYSTCGTHRVTPCLFEDWNIGSVLLLKRIDSEAIHVFF